MALSLVCEFIFQKVLPSDPYDTTGSQGYAVTWPEIVEICKLLARLGNDGALYQLVRSVRQSVRPKGRGTSFNPQQISDIAGRLEDLAQSRLPSKRFIRHPGYQIAVRAEAAAVRRAGRQQFIDLVEEAEGLPNVADSAFLLCLLVEAMPAREADLKRRCLEKVSELLGQIPTLRDRIDRYEALARVARDADSQLARSSLSSAMELTLQADTPDLHATQRRIVDMAFQLDPDLAAALVSMTEKDPATLAAAANTRRRLASLQLKERATKEGFESLTPDSTANTNLPRAAWMMLASLNSGKLTPVHINRTRPALRLAAELPMSQGYPILTFVVENAARRYAGTPHAAQYLRPLFQAGLVAADLSFALAQRSAGIAGTGSLLNGLLAEKGHELIPAGERERATEVIRKWFAEYVHDYLVICDPYFGPEDLQIIKLLMGKKSDCRVSVLTGRRHQEQLRVPRPWGDAYRDHWKQISDQPPPDTRILVVGKASTGDPPFHDRYVLTAGSGLRLGTSYRSMGLEKDSEISRLSAEEANHIEFEQLRRYLDLSQYEHRGEKLTYYLIDLI